MRQTRQAVFRHPRARGVALTALAVAVVNQVGCGYDDGDWQIDQGSGASSTRGGASSAGVGNRSGSGNQVGGEGGQSAPAEYPQPAIVSMEPKSGPYGTVVTVRGSGLGNPTLKGFTLVVGDRGEVELDPDREEVVSWTDEEIVFRYPFPAEGAVSLEGLEGSALAGEFVPSWHIARELEQAPAASVIASISAEPGRITMLFDTMPLTLLDVGRDGVVEHAVTASEIETQSVRLYLNATGLVEGIAVSTGADPVLVHLENREGDLVAVPTSLKLAASEYQVAGGSEGAALWMKRSAGWHRARWSSGAWKIDKGPIADPEPNAPDRAAGASSDGSLYLAKSVDSGNLLDDMEAPYMQRLSPTAATFGAATRAGSSVDDYITALELRSSGDGLVVRVCGSDVDPFGLSGRDHYCFDSLHAPGGAQLSGVPLNARASAHAFTRERAVAAYCASDGSWLIRTDADVAEPEVPPGEVVSFPCPEAVALEVSGNGDYLPVVRHEERTYLLERNPAFTGAGGEGGEGGEGGAGGAAAAGAAGAGGASP